MRISTKAVFFTAVLMEYAFCVLTLIPAIPEGVRAGFALSMVACAGVGAGALLYEKKHGGDSVAD